MRLVRSPRLVRNIFSSALWKIEQRDPVLYLSFDDGPSPRTHEILTLLKNYDALATFFCVGQNVERYPNCLEDIRKAGHRIGNHTHTHRKGWKVSKKTYLDDVERAQKSIKSDLFRPPYGKMTLGQYRALKKKYRVVMWSHLSYDFDPEMPVDHFLVKLQSDFKGGEIVVLHDNIKYFDRSFEMLQKILAWSKVEGIKCAAIPRV